MTRRNNNQVFIVNSIEAAVDLINNLTGTRNYEEELFEKVSSELLSDIASKIVCDTLQPKNREHYIDIINNSLPKESDKVISKKVIVILNIIKNMCMKQIEDHKKQFEINKNIVKNCLKSHLLETLIAMCLILQFVNVEEMMEDLDEEKDNINDKEYLKYCNLYRDIHKFVNIVNTYLEDKHNITIKLSPL